MPGPGLMIESELMNCGARLSAMLRRLLRSFKRQEVTVLMNTNSSWLLSEAWWNLGCQTKLEFLPRQLKPHSGERKHESSYQMHSEPDADCAPEGRKKWFEFRLASGDG